MAEPLVQIQTPITTGTGSVVVLQANPHRHSVLLVNDSDTVIYLAKAPTAVLNAGIRLNANGGSYEDLMCGYDGSIYTGMYSAINAVGSKTLLVNEYAS